MSDSREPSKINYDLPVVGRNTASQLNKATYQHSEASDQLEIIHGKNAVDQKYLNIQLLRLRTFSHNYVNINWIRLECFWDGWMAEGLYSDCPRKGSSRGWSKETVGNYRYCDVGMIYDADSRNAGVLWPSGDSEQSYEHKFAPPDMINLVVFSRFNAERRIEKKRHVRGMSLGKQVEKKMRLAEAVLTPIKNQSTNQTTVDNKFMRS